MRLNEKSSVLRRPADPAAYPDADLSQVMSQEGINAMDVLEEGCTDEVFEVFNPMPYESVVIGDFMKIEPWKTILEENPL